MASCRTSRLWRPRRARLIKRGLSAAQDEISWAQPAYLIAVRSLGDSIVGLKFTRVFSTLKWLFAASAAGFTVMSLFCGMGVEHPEHDCFSSAAGALLGVSMIPTGFYIIIPHFQRTVCRVYSSMVIGTTASSVALPLGPVIGGWITGHVELVWLLYVNLIPGLAVTILISLLVDIDKPDFSLVKEADYLGIVLMAAGLGCLEYVLEEGVRWNWFDDATITACTLIAVVAGVLFIIRSLTFARPVVDLRAFGNRNFLIGCILSFVTGVGIFATIFLTPLFLGYRQGSVPGRLAWPFPRRGWRHWPECRSTSCWRANSTRAG